MKLNDMQRRAWAEIDLDALEYNYKKIRRIIPEKAKICCVVKADAYGHGSVRVAQLCEELGADHLAVSNINEAMTLRNAGIGLPILILGYTPPSCAEMLAHNGISQCVYSCEYGKELADAAERAGVRISAHFKIDVGMGRLGFVIRDKDPDDLEKLTEICKNDSFIPGGIFTHFPMAGEGTADKGISQKQFKRFLDIYDALSDQDINFDIKHCSNSAAALKYTDFGLDMVRVGIALYGVAPSDDTADIGLMNTLSLKSVISNIKTVKKGETVGYGSEYAAPRDVTVATLPIGYADGFKCENFRNGTKISVGGVLCDIVGRVCMDQTMIDVSAVNDIKIGDEAVIYGHGSSVTLEEFSKNNGKIPYETMCEISARVPRVYRRHGETESIRESFV